MEQLLKAFNDVSPLGSGAAKDLAALFAAATLSQEAFFAREGTFDSKIAFIKQGITRAYFINRNGEELTKIFSRDLGFICPYTSVLTRTKNMINIQAITDCKLFVADYYELEALFDKYPEIERGIRKFAEYFFIQRERREVGLATLDPAARLKAFEENYPGLAAQIPGQYLASYLDIPIKELKNIL
ncbi:hypothetical protein COR50_19285 [Chitinophaga caeni]|uniref:Cyclic nucleotide-binding domain-containing protein n=1 Tax=Chitinophaga caeni TaxID=2029983 RepID=A0A291QYY1_9BACT|nr:Crp/Fnr family transcriptional regulator [Chitinophaga caeni]ATL49145.1 hypothetical protein COR50_19285 [Chitinophaga caeni]